MPEPIPGTAASSSFHNGWHYNSSETFQVQLPQGLVQLPYPLGRGDGCPAALQIMIRLSAMTYRANDLMDAALSSYFDNKL